MPAIGYNWDDVWADVWDAVWSEDAPVVADRKVPSWYYTPGPAPGNADQWVRRELDRIAQATRGAAPFVQLQVLAVAPDRPRKGMLIYADGTNLDLGSGAGVYVYSGSAWVFLGGTGTGVSDHGALTGLADDDHSQYHNDTRGDARYPRLATTNTFTAGSQIVSPSALTDGANIATNAALSNSFTVTLGGNRTLNNPTNLVHGGIYQWIIKQDGTGSRTLAYGTKFKFAAGASSTLTTTANKYDLLSGIYHSTADILMCNLLKDFG